MESTIKSKIDDLMSEVVRLKHLLIIFWDSFYRGNGRFIHSVNPIQVQARVFLAQFFLLMRREISIAIDSSLNQNWRLHKKLIAMLIHFRVCPTGQLPSQQGMPG